MRTFPVASALARGCLSTTIVSTTILLGAAALTPAQAQGAAKLPAPTPAGAITAPATRPGTFEQLRANLGEGDREVALRALHIALDELSDGAAFVWRSKAHGITGVIRPTMAFRDDEGRVCRHLVYSVALGRFQKRIEGVACRSLNGRWMLAD